MAKFNGSLGHYNSFNANAIDNLFNVAGQALPTALAYLDSSLKKKEEEQLNSFAASRQDMITSFITKIDYNKQTGNYDADSLNRIFDSDKSVEMLIDAFNGAYAGSADGSYVVVPEADKEQFAKYLRKRFGYTEQDAKDNNTFIGANIGKGNLDPTKWSVRAGGVKSVEETLKDTDYEKLNEYAGKLFGSGDNSILSKVTASEDVSRYDKDMETALGEITAESIYKQFHGKIPMGTVQEWYATEYDKMKNDFINYDMPEIKKAGNNAKLNRALEADILDIDSYSSSNPETFAEGFKNLYSARGGFSLDSQGLRYAKNDAIIASMYNAEKQTALLAQTSPYMTVDELSAYSKDMFRKSMGALRGKEGFENITDEDIEIALKRVQKEIEQQSLADFKVAQEKITQEISTADTRFSYAMIDVSNTGEYPSVDDIALWYGGVDKIVQDPRRKTQFKLAIDKLNASVASEQILLHMPNIESEADTLIEEILSGKRPVADGTVHYDTEEFLAGNAKPFAFDGESRDVKRPELYNATPFAISQLVTLSKKTYANATTFDNSGSADTIVYDDKVVKLIDKVGFDKLLKQVPEEYRENGILKLELASWYNDRIDTMLKSNSSSSGGGSGASADAEFTGKSLMKMAETQNYDEYIRWLTNEYNSGRCTKTQYNDALNLKQLPQQQQEAMASFSKYAKLLIKDAYDLDGDEAELALGYFYNEGSEDAFNIALKSFNEGKGITATDVKKYLDPIINRMAEDKLVTVINEFKAGYAKEKGDARSMYNTINLNKDIVGIYRDSVDPLCQWNFDSSILEQARMVALSPSNSKETGVNNTVENMFGIREFLSEAVYGKDFGSLSEIENAAVTANAIAVSYEVCQMQYLKSSLAPEEKYEDMYVFGRMPDGNPCYINKKNRAAYYSDWYSDGSVTKMTYLKLDEAYDDLIKNGLNVQVPQSAVDNGQTRLWYRVLSEFNPANSGSKNIEAAREAVKQSKELLSTPSITGVGKYMFTNAMLDSDYVNTL